VRKHPFQLPTASFGAAFYRLRARRGERDSREGTITLVSSADEFRGSREPGKLSGDPNGRDRRIQEFKDAGIRESEGSGSREVGLAKFQDVPRGVRDNFGTWTERGSK